MWLSSNVIDIIPTIHFPAYYATILVNNMSYFTNTSYDMQ